MTKEKALSNNTRARRPVYSGNRRIPGLYERTLAWVMARRPLALGFSFVILAATGYLFWSTPKGLFPTDDTGQLPALVRVPILYRIYYNDGTIGNLFMMNGLVNDRALSDFVDRYQAFDYQGISAAIGTSITSGVPEPATWSMMILGIGLAGAAMRRKRRTLALAAA